MKGIRRALPRAGLPLPTFHTSCMQQAHILKVPLASLIAVTDTDKLAGPHSSVESPPLHLSNLLAYAPHSALAETLQAPPQHVTITRTLAAAVAPEQSRQHCSCSLNPAPNQQSHLSPSAQ
jgi:hypothetical protein